MTIKDVKSIIDELDLIDPNEDFAYEKAILLFLKIRKLPVFQFEIPNDTIVFRARTHEDDTFYKNVTDISFAPKTLVKDYARCSRPFQSKFYCSENRPTSYMELIENWIETKKEGDKVYVTIGRWRLKKPMRVILVTSPDKEKRVSDFDKVHGIAFDKMLKASDPEIREATIELFRYLFSKFRKAAGHDPKTYIITSAYSNLSLALCEGKADGIYYPSVPANYQGVNFAINSNFVSSDKMELEYVIRNSFMVIKDEFGKLSFEETGLWDALNIDEYNNLIKW